MWDLSVFALYTQRKSLLSWSSSKIQCGAEYVAQLWSTYLASTGPQFNAQKTHTQEKQKFVMHALNEFILKARIEANIAKSDK